MSVSATPYLVDWDFLQREFAARGAEAAVEAWMSAELPPDEVESYDEPLYNEGMDTLSNIYDEVREFLPRRRQVVFDPIFGCLFWMNGEDKPAYSGTASPFVAYAPETLRRASEAWRKAPVKGLRKACQKCIDKDVYLFDLDNAEEIVELMKEWVAIADAAARSGRGMLLYIA